MLACHEGHVHIVNMLINNDAHINLQNKVYSFKVIVRTLHLSLTTSQDVHKGLVLIIYLG